MATTQIAETEAHAVLRYAPQGMVLRDFHQSNHFVRCLIGPLGSGKTQACIVEVFNKIHKQKPDDNGIRRSRWVVVRNTYVDLQSTTIKDWREVTGPLEVGRFVNGSNPTHYLDYQRADGTRVIAEVLFLAFDRPDDVRKIRGIQATGVWANEVKELNKEVIDMLLARVGRYPSRAQLGNYYYGMVADSNAPSADHWLGNLALDVKPDEWSFHIQPGAVQKIDGAWRQNQQAENLNNLPEGYYMRQISAHSEDWIRANLANEFILVIDGRPVHPDFSQTQHVSDHELLPTPGRDLTIGIDFGRTPAAVIMQQQNDGRWFVLQELVTTNMGALRFGEILRQILNESYPNFNVDSFGDPAGSQMAQTDDQTPFMMLERSGIYAWPAPTNEFEQRTTALDVNLRRMIEGNPAILIDPRCKTLIRGLAGAYQFKRVRTNDGDRFHDKPVKDSTSHVVESMHYGLLGAGEGAELFNSGWIEEYDSVENDFDGWAPATQLSGLR